MAITGQDDTLLARIAELEREVEALADANVRAAELMAELDDARSETSALERRTEELTLRHEIELVVVRSRSEHELSLGILAVLRRADCLQQRDPAAIVCSDGDTLESVGHVPHAVEAEIRELIAGQRPPERQWGEHMVVPLRSGTGVVGALVLFARITPAWFERWAALLGSVGLVIGSAVERLRYENELERMAVDLQRARDEALEASRAKSRFLANMSHELRTPLNAIIGYSEMLRDDAMAEGSAQYAPDLQKIVTAGRHLLVLISDVLDISKIEAGRMEIEPIWFDLRSMVDQVVESIEPQMRRNSNTLHVQLPEALVPLYSDQNRLVQCLLNLLSNAAKFTQRGEVSLVVDQDAEGTRFTVRDTGIGMRPDQLERVLDPFTQADQSTTRRFGGTGLGLAITRALCDMLGGELEVASEEGAGSTFSFRLPHPPAPTNG